MVPGVMMSIEENLYAGEAFARKVLFSAETGYKGLTVQELERRHNEDSLAVLLEKNFEDFDGSDHDVVTILGELLSRRKQEPELQYPSISRALAVFWWTNYQEKVERVLLRRRANSYRQMKELYQLVNIQAFAADITVRISDFAEENFIFEHAEKEDLQLAGFYLAEKLSDPTLCFAIQKQAYQLASRLKERLKTEGLWHEVYGLLTEEELSLRERIQLGKDWLWSSSFNKNILEEELLFESVAYLMTPNNNWIVSELENPLIVRGLKGTHPSITAGEMNIPWKGILQTV